MRRAIRHFQTRFAAARPVAAARCTLLVLAVWLTIPSITHANVFACERSDGTVQYQDRPCPQAQQVQRNLSRRSQLQPEYPAGIHASWFEQPGDTGLRAFCNEQNCSCGTQTVSLDSGILQAVGNALYLDGSWHRYESLEQELKKTQPSNDEARKLRVSLGEAACNILISQTILREHLQAALVEARKLARTAEDRGYDTPDICLDDTNWYTEEEIAEACDLHDFFLMNQRLQADTRSLNTARHPYASANGLLSEIDDRGD